MVGSQSIWLLTMIQDVFVPSEGYGCYIWVATNCMFCQIFYSKLVGQVNATIVAIYLLEIKDPFRVLASC